MKLIENTTHLAPCKTCGNPILYGTMAYQGSDGSLHHERCQQQTATDRKQKDEPMRVTAFREALWNLMGEPTKAEALDTIATDLNHVMEDLESLKQSMEALQTDLLGLWKMEKEEKKDA